MSNEWIEWNGGSFLCDDDKLIEVLFVGDPIQVLTPRALKSAVVAGTIKENVVAAYRLHVPQQASDRQVAGTHYKAMGVEPWDVVDTWPLEQRIGAYRHGALKYLMRMGSKDESAQEIAKGIHYMEKLLEVLKA